MPSSAATVGSSVWLGVGATVGVDVADPVALPLGGAAGVGATDVALSPPSASGGSDGETVGAAAVSLALKSSTG